MFINEGFPLASSIWFFFSLFLCNVGFRIIDEKVSKISKAIILVTLGTLGLYEKCLFSNRLPLTIGPTAVGLLFFYLGVICKTYDFFSLLDNNLKLGKVGLLLVFIGSCNLRSQPSFAGGDFVNEYLFLLMAVFNSFSLIVSALF